MGTTSAAEPPIGRRRGYPRPQLERDQWASLDGAWDFAKDLDGRWARPSDVEWAGRIVVPFAPECPASGIGDTGFQRVCWYRRTIDLPAVEEGERVVLHFGAVDYSATVWLDGHLLARHEGGYTPFSADLTPAIESTGGSHVLVVRAEDDPSDLGKPRGKQDWELEPHSIWYHRTTGIWQTVWWERVPAASITQVRWTADLERLQVGMVVGLEGHRPGLRLQVSLRAGARELVDDVITVRGHVLERGLVLDGAGIEAHRDELTWSPEQPVLIDADLSLVDTDGTVVDRVRSYTAMRSVGVGEGRFLLNGRPYPLRLVLDQGYWPDGGLTAPGDDALRRDVELAKALGFNGVRKHQKAEDPRYLYWADRIGLLVWAEMPPSYRFDERAMRRTVREWSDVIERDRSHPCIAAWVTFNESCGVLDLPTRPDQRDFVRAVSLLTKALDPTRPVVSNDGWENIGGDILGVHDYDQRAAELAGRYGGRLHEALEGYDHHGRLRYLDGEPAARPVVLSEFGGIGWSDREATTTPTDPVNAPTEHLVKAWGYSTADSPEDLARRYATMVTAARSIEGLAGFCYTQFADTYQEVNGLLRADRTPKAPIDDIARATRGEPPAHATPTRRRASDRLLRDVSRIEQT